LCRRCESQLEIVISIIREREREFAAIQSLQTHVVISGREKVEVRDPLVAKVEAGGDFFKQFWVGPPDRCEKKQKKETTQSLDQRTW
jgi:hypothetical protein